ncbi:Lon protease, partial [human gut metagenome]
ICKIKQILKMSENTIRVLVEGLERAKIVEYIEDDEYIKASVETSLFIFSKISSALAIISRHSKTSCFASSSVIAYEATISKYSIGLS